MNKWKITLYNDGRDNSHTAKSVMKCDVAPANIEDIAKILLSNGDYIKRKLWKVWKFRKDFTHIMNVPK